MLDQTLPEGAPVSAGAPSARLESDALPAGERSAWSPAEREVQRIADALLTWRGEEPVAAIAGLVPVLQDMATMTADAEGSARRVVPPVAWRARGHQLIVLFDDALRAGVDTDRWAVPLTEVRRAVHAPGHEAAPRST